MRVAPGRRGARHPGAGVSAVGWRRLLHRSHAAATLVLLASGVLLQAPDLRAGLVGGYGREISLVHRAAGVLFVLVPLAALLRAGRPLARDALRRLDPPDPRAWRQLHLVLSLGATPLLALTGLLPWLGARIPAAIGDLALEAHAALAWLFLAMLAAHLLAVRRKLGARFRDLREGRASPGDEPGDPLELPDEPGRS
ncbi:MAG: cytochrome b/b6 domain-containing protein [Deltaproteobacteria bacterium]|nr:cytochrome b/b6 domain-containing protein [Deltaproteobacteria bacterium]